MSGRSLVIHLPMKMDNEGAFSQCGTKEWQMNALTSMGTGINAKIIFREKQTASYTAHQLYLHRYICSIIKMRMQVDK